MLKKTLLTSCAMLALLSVQADSPLPVSKWNISESSKLKIVEKNGILELDFNITPDRLDRSGHRIFYIGEADLFLKKPISLTPETERVIFEFANSKTRSDCEITLHPLIRDAEGELFVFQPHAFPHLNSAQKTWGKWMTPSFYSGEAGAATHDIYYIGGTPKNYKLDGKLEFIGFKLAVRRYTTNNPNAEKKLPLKGSVQLGDFNMLGQRVSYSNPFAYADSFLTKQGSYTFAVQILNCFQAPPVAEFKKTISFDPANPASCKQKLEFPLGPDDNYWINYQITDADGNVVKSGFMRQEVLNNPDKSPLKAVDTKKAPSLGLVRINPDHKTNGVYQRPESAEIELRVFPQGKKNLTVDWKVLAYDFPNVLNKGSSALEFKDDSFHSLKLIPRTTLTRDAYRLMVEIKDGSKVIDSQVYYFGFKTDPKKSHDRVGEMVDRRKIKQQPYNRTTYLLPKKGINTEEEADKNFRQFLTSSSPMALSLTYMIDLNDFEVLPGVFNYAMLDRIMDAAADHGNKVTVRLAHADEHEKNLYRWLKYTRQYSYDGTIASGHAYYGAYAVTDPTTQKLWLDSYRALYNRYNKHTAFEGYYVMQPGGEWTVVDQPWVGTLTGYDPMSIQSFRDWLKKSFTLAELNARWGSSCKTWNDVTVPYPDFRGGANPDLRMQWVDFNRFKSALGSDIWMPTAIENIRTFDNDRITICYGAPNVLAKKLSGKIDYGHNGGNHYGNKLGEFIEPWEKGKIGWITEPHHPHRWAAYGDLAEKGWVLDWSVWVMTAQAAGGGANLHVYYMPNPTLDLAAHYGGGFAFDAFEKFRPILTELHGMKLISPKKEIAVNHDRYTLYTKHRTTFGARLDDLKRWFELLDADSVPSVSLNPEKLSDYKLVLPNILDEVISKENLDLYDKAVRGGAKMIITANTGKFVPELGKEPFQLLKKLGIKAPVSAYCGRGANVIATAETNAPLLFTPGQKIAFQTSDSLHTQLNSDEVKKTFWMYPYRWIPETDYFGYYPGMNVSDGKVLARFADGGAAASLHKVGKGEVVVFWGTPDMSGGKLAGMMSRAADWANVVNPLKKNPLRYTLEGKNDKLKRHYLMVFCDKPGTYTLQVPNVPDGDWFLDDPVSSMRLGRYSGKHMRENGLELTWIDGYSPLKYIRMIPVKSTFANWTDKYKIVPQDGKK